MNIVVLETCRGTQ